LCYIIDSLFIILRKKNQQLSFLHVYHHATMFGLWWIGTKYVAGGSSFLGAMFNCVVHVFMYTYYALAACGESMKPYLWWKKYLTLIQVNICSIKYWDTLICSSMLMFHKPSQLDCINYCFRIGCDFPMWMQYSLVGYMFSFLVLFSDFYYKAYIQQRNEKLFKQNGNSRSNRKNGTKSNGNGQSNGKQNIANGKKNL
ncbi:elongation of very long chain fatty acids protein 4, partial [Eurytemora carolleeae]|uniref:elongation of very long chain fatty acids protein 4 n=1 Tax=Eurytemora carolleeae TaxID=1294199 RepID=UPI000C77341E